MCRAGEIQTNQLDPLIHRTTLTGDVLGLTLQIWKLRPREVKWLVPKLPQQKVAGGPGGVPQKRYECLLFPFLPEVAQSTGPVKPLVGFDYLLVAGVCQHPQ